MAMAAAVAALAAGRGRASTALDAVATSYPAFLEDLVALTAGRRASEARRRRRPVGARRAPVVIAIDGPGGLGQVDGLAGAWPSGSGSTASTPGPCTGRWPGPRSERGIDPGDGRPWPPSPPRPTIEVGAVGVRMDGTRRDRRDPVPGRQPGGVGRGRQPRGPARSWSKRQRRGRPRHGGGVVEGRDIGTVVFPDAT